MTTATLLTPTPIQPKHLPLYNETNYILLRHCQTRRTVTHPTVIIAVGATVGHVTLSEAIAVCTTCTAIIVEAFTVYCASTGGSENTITLATNVSTVTIRIPPTYH